MLVKLRSYWNRMGTNPMSSVFIRGEKRNTEIHRYIQEECHLMIEAEIGVITSTRQKTPGIASSYQKLRKMHRIVSSS